MYPRPIQFETKDLAVERELQLMRERRRGRARGRGRDPAAAADRLAEASVRDDAGRWAAVVAGALAGRR